MFIIECLPFSKGLNKESLSYFGPKYIEPGSIIKVTLRNKLVAALVLSSKDAAEAKAEIRTADFQLKKISPTGAAPKPFLEPEFLEAVMESADFFAASPSNLLPHLIPSVVLENPNSFQFPKSKAEEKKEDEEEGGKKPKSEACVLQSPDEERFAHYRSLIREEFARKRSVFVCVPQNEDVAQTREKIERGIESFVCAFHSEMSKKELAKEWKKACASEHPVLIVGTARWLIAPRRDLGSLIVERENESGWKALARPYFDLRTFAEILARKKKMRAVYGDSFLRTETLYRYKQGELAECENVKWRLPAEIDTKIADMRKAVGEDKEFKAISPELLSIIKETVNMGGNMFIFAARKGLSSVTVCRDCGEQVKCNNCGSPMILYKTKSSASEGGVFKCHQCGETRDAAEVCQRCGSWKLAAFGAGIDRVGDELKKEFPELKLFEIHKDVTSTGAKALTAAEEFYSTRGAVLLGTEMALSYLVKKVTVSAIASFDSLFSIPDFRIREKIFRLIFQIRNLAKDRFLIQTRNPSDPTVEFALSGNLVEFYKSEMDDRAALNYPPLSIFIKITVRGTKNFTSKEIEKLKDTLADWNPAIFSSIHEKRGEQSAVNAVIKIDRKKWPASAHAPAAPSLLSVLRALPPHFEIKVDPDNLL